MSKKVKMNFWKNVKESGFELYRRYFSFNIHKCLYHIVFPEYFRPQEMKSIYQKSTRIVNIKKFGTCEIENSIIVFFFPNSFKIAAQKVPILKMGTKETLFGLTEIVKCDEKSINKIVSAYIKITTQTKKPFQFLLYETNIETLSDIPLKFDAEFITHNSNDFIVRCSDFESNKATIFKLVNLEKQTIFYNLEINVITSSENASFPNELKYYNTNELEYDFENRCFRRLMQIRRLHFKYKPVKLTCEYLLVDNDLVSWAHEKHNSPTPESQICPTPTENPEIEDEQEDQIYEP
jgi:hypothetical protein